MPPTLLPDPTRLRLDLLRASDSSITVVMVTSAPRTSCPLCRTLSAHVHSRYVRTLADLPWHGIAVSVRLTVRRFFCENVDCTRRIFGERLPGIVAPYARRTARLNEAFALVGFALGGEAGARVLRHLAMAGSPDTLLRTIRATSLAQHDDPRILGIDDFAFRRGHRYGTILVDLERHCVIDLLPDRKPGTLIAWLEQHAHPQVISRDRGGPPPRSGAACTMRYRNCGPGWTRSTGSWPICASGWKRWPATCWTAPPEVSTGAGTDVGPIQHWRTRYDQQPPTAHPRPSYRDCACAQRRPEQAGGTVMPKRNEQASGKRTYGKGSITERRNAANAVTGYQAQVRLDDGRKRSKTFATEREAERWLVEARKLAARGEMNRPGVPTLHAYLTKTWLPTISQSIKWGTRTGYELNVRRLPAELVRMRLDRIKPGDVQTVYNTLTERGLAPASVRQVHAVLHKAFEDALHFGYVSRNPCHGTTLPRMSRAERPWYTDAQVRRLFDATAGDRFHALWVVLGTLGLRNGEARGLMWTDVDWDRSTVNIRRTLYRPGKGSGLILEEPKTTRSRRTVALPAETVEALRAHQDRQEWERRRAGSAWQENGLIFTSDIGTPLEHGRVIRQWREAVEKAGLPKIRVHDLRHSVASNLLSAGRPPERVARMLGHANVTMLLNVYGHIIPSDFRAEADAMQAALSRHREAR